MADVVRTAAVLPARAHPRLLPLAVVLLMSASAEWMAVRTGITENIVWLPRTPLSLLAGHGGAMGDARDLRRTTPPPQGVRKLHRLGATLMVVLGVFLVARAVAEPVLLLRAAPASFEHDWGGPTKSGVLAVHCVPGIVALVLLVRFAVRRLGSSGSPPS